MKTAWFTFLLLLITLRVGARQEQAFTTLEDLVAASDYIVIAEVGARSSELYHDGWVKRECRFIYWLKAPQVGKPGELQELAPNGDQKKQKPIPLHTFSGSDEPPPGTPKTKFVILVDDHEKSYHRIIGDEQFRAHLQASDGTGPVVHAHFQLLFLRKGEKNELVTVGTSQSILPVSADLDMLELPPQPHVTIDGIGLKKQKLEAAIRFIVDDFIRFKQRELAQAKEDLQPVLVKPNVQK